jgi:ABC-type Fe3+ transport system substrate-binding protein
MFPFLIAAVGYLALIVNLAAAAEVAPQWEKALEAAKKEGQLVLAANPGTQEIFTEFQKKYPEIKVVAAPGRGDPSQILAERRAGKYVVDLIIRGMTDMSPLYKAKALDPVKPTLMLPEVLDESKWWGGKHLYKDEEKQYILATDLTVLTSFAYNTKLVDPKEIKSYWDFLNPKWKGKILLLEPASGGTGTSLQFLITIASLDPSLSAGF